MKDNRENQKQFLILYFVILFALCLIVALSTVIIDPFFHYHKPINGLQYPLNKGRYQNDGITRHFEYDAMITGSSMAEPMQTSTLDELFGTHSIKVCYMAGTFCEVKDYIEAAYRYNPDIKMIVWPLDLYALEYDKDLMPYHSIPTYLYNQNPFDDVNYILNKEVFIKETLNVLDYTKSGALTTSFDEYAQPTDPFGKEYALSFSDRPEKIKKKQKKYTTEESQKIMANINQNITSVLENHPETQFYLCFSPYSVLYWDKQFRLGKLNYHMDMEKEVIETLLSYPNVHLYSFAQNTDITCNLDYYRDTVHYSREVCVDMLHYMKEGQYELTLDNYEAYLEDITSIYQNMDYDSFYE